MKKNKVLTSLLALFLIVNAIGFPTFAFAAINENYAARVSGSLERDIKYQGRDTYTVGFQVQTLNGAQLFANQALFIAYDATVFEWVSYDATTNLGGAGLSLGTGFKEFGGCEVAWTLSGWNESIFGAISTDGKTGYIQFAPYRMTGAKVSLTDFTTLQSVRLAFVPGKAFADVSASSIRLINLEERDALVLSDIMLLNDGDEFHFYGNRNLEDTLPKPIIRLQLLTGSAPVTSIKIDAPVMVTVSRGRTYQFKVTLNDGAADDNVDWLVSNPSYAQADNSGTVKIFDKTGTLVLIAIDPVSGLSSSVVLRVV